MERKLSRTRTPDSASESVGHEHEEGEPEDDCNRNRRGRGHRFFPALRPFFRRHRLVSGPIERPNTNDECLDHADSAAHDGQSEKPAAFRIGFMRPGLNGDAARGRAHGRGDSMRTAHHHTLDNRLPAHGQLGGHCLAVLSSRLLRIVAALCSVICHRGEHR